MKIVPLVKIRPEPVPARAAGVARRALAVSFASAMTLVAFGVLAQGRAQPTLPVLRLQAGMHIVKAEVADTPGSRQTGLMWRTRLGPNEGMLFVFEQKATQCFWMRNTLVPLSIAFLDDDGRVVNIADMTPRSEHSHCAARPVRFALEMEQGWFARRGISVGARLVQPQVFPGQSATAR